MLAIGRLKGAKAFQIGKERFGNSHFHTALSDLTVNDLRDLVKNNFADTLPQTVLDELGIERPATAISDNVKYSKELGDTNSEGTILSKEQEKKVENPKVRDEEYIAFYPFDEGRNSAGCQTYSYRNSVKQSRLVFRH